MTDLPAVVDLAAQELSARIDGDTLTVTIDRPEKRNALTADGYHGIKRAAMIVADVSRGMEAEAAKLRTDLEEVQVLRQLQESAARRLSDGLRGVQEARTALSQAVSDRTDLPRKFTEDPIQTGLLIASTETLGAFASGLADIAEDERPLDLPPVSALRGDIPLRDERHRGL